MNSRAKAIKSFVNCITSIGFMGKPESGFDYIIPCSDLTAEPKYS